MLSECIYTSGGGGTDLTSPVGVGGGSVSSGSRTITVSTSEKAKLLLAAAYNTSYGTYLFVVDMDNVEGYYINNGAKTALSNPQTFFTRTDNSVTFNLYSFMGAAAYCQIACYT